MPGNERLIGVGLAMVDEKIRQPGVVLPTAEELIEFLDRQQDYTREAGGVTPNIMATLAAFDPAANTRLLACVGEDDRGAFYSSRTSRHLGPLQVAPGIRTGVVASLIDDETGIVYRRDRYLGAAEQVRVSKEEERATLLLSDLTTLRLPRVFEETDKLLSSLQGGNFFINLAGLNPALAPRGNLISVLAALRKEPDIVTGNRSEFTYLTGQTDDVTTLVSAAFPSSRIVVLTLEAEGALVRYEDEILQVPAYYVPANKVVDETGAGDTHTGVMLGALCTKPYSEWTKDDVLHACSAGAYGATKVLQTTRSRLTHAEMKAVRRYYSAL